MIDQFTCPHCGKAIELTESLASHVADEIRQQVKSEYEKKSRVFLETKTKAMQEELEQKNKALDEFAKNELELRKQKLAIEQAKKNFELEMTRKLDNERQKIQEEAQKQVLDEQRLKDAEKDKKIADMLKTIEELKRKGQQGSMQTQGEVLELDLEAALRQAFPADIISPVPKGVRGADVVQKVRDNPGNEAGVILWESKRTKAWSDQWVTKLKDDMRLVKANIAILVTEVLPEGLSVFGQYQGIWVSSYPTMINLAHALRNQLLELYRVQIIQVGKGEKIEAMYNYITSDQFRQKIGSIMDTYVSMKSDLEKEKRSMEQIWSKRDKQIEGITKNTAQIYGDMQGITGQVLKPIENLELESGEDAQPF